MQHFAQFGRTFQYQLTYQVWQIKSMIYLLVREKSNTSQYLLCSSLKCDIKVSVYNRWIRWEEFIFVYKPAKLDISIINSDEENKLNAKSVPKIKVF